MPHIGQIDTLTVLSKVDFGVYLDAGEQLGRVLLPKRYVTSELNEGDEVSVFLYHDSEDRIVATTEQPHVMLDQCANLKVAEVNKVGAFLDWGLPKDLLLPFKEQTRPVEEGEYCVVYVYYDHDTGRLAATQYLDDFLGDTADCYRYGETVSLLIASQTPLGYKVVINNSHIGVVYANEIAQPLRVGQKLKGYIKQPRADGKIDVSVTLLNAASRGDLAQTILNHLRDNDGHSPLNDKSAPDDIFKQFKVSKANFKKAIGGLYRQKLISIEKDGIRLI